ncbi:TATA box-binding protein-associated factor RNA polymerase I subunit D [Elgaria multicarinata webbii]|uniref:TATA box-binding protein-associated factor RNA polymerase I subunit D n=1 Tax=Elgaria multicarinata webbii TaxID=159646 RepID=UPI002FCCBCA3
MADSDEAESSAGVSPDNRVSEVRTRSTLCSLKHSRKEAQTESSARLAKYGQAQGGPSDGSVKPGDRLKWLRSKIGLKAIFDYHFRIKANRRRRRRGSDQRRDVCKRRAICKTSQERTKFRRKKIPTAELNRQYTARGLQFPLVERCYGRKHLPFKMVFQYEEAALRGYFKYIERMKYEHHLKESLTQLDAGGDLEKECLESRKHKYLDDDGPLSPIEETNGEDPNGNPDDEDIGAKIVEKSSFILSSIIPKKKKCKRKKNNCEMNDLDDTTM